MTKFLLSLIFLGGGVVFEMNAHIYYLNKTEETLKLPLPINDHDWTFSFARTEPKNPIDGVNVSLV